MKLTINAEELRGFEACDSGLETFVEAHGEKTVSLSDALESNDSDDFWWLIGEFHDRNLLSDSQDQDLRILAARYAERSLRFFESEFPEDKRPAQAIQAAKDYAEGKISKEELAAAWAAGAARAAGAAGAAGDAGDAAWAAARAAAWAAAGAAAGDAAWAAARAAAGDAAAWAAGAAGAAARVAARAAGAAGDAAGGAAWAAAGDAAWAAGAAARVAARAAGAAGAAAGDAAGDAEKEWQTEVLKKVLANWEKQNES